MKEEEGGNLEEFKVYLEEGISPHLKVVNMNLSSKS